MPEIEAKFLVQRPEQLQSVLQTLEELGFSISEGSTEALEDRYFDTPDWVILRAGWAYRCRQKEGSTTLALKALGGGRGPVFVRDEIEQSLPDIPRPDGKLPAGPVSRRLKEIINGHRSQELFRVRSQRKRYEVSRSQGNPVSIELALDRSEILAHEPVPGEQPHTLNFTELELELEEGSRQTLTELVRDLTERTGILPARLSKFERGLYAAKLDPHGSETRHFTLDDRMLDLAYDYLGRKFAAMKQQAPRAWEGLELGGVHRMRVAIRRVRAMLRALRDVAPDDELAGFNRELRWLATALGKVRDNDVHTDKLHRYMEALSKDDAKTLRPYTRHLGKQRKKARNGLIRVLSSERYSKLVSTFQRFLNAGPSPAALQHAGDLRIGAGAHALLHNPARILLHKGRKITSNSPPEKLHALRIRTKRVRYLLECFRDCYEDRLEDPVTSLRHLQDVLGDFQDAFLARRRLRDYAASLGRKKANRKHLLALGCLLHEERQRASKARHRFPKAWRRLERAAVGGTLESDILSPSPR